VWSTPINRNNDEFFGVSVYGKFYKNEKIIENHSGK
jgi:hypothetical protein